MSSRVVIRTLKFCTSKIENLEHAIKLLNLDCTLLDKHFLVSNHRIEISNDVFYMNIANTDAIGLNLFNNINSKLAEVEALVKNQELARLKRERENAEVEQEGFRIRRIKSEEEKIRYEKEKLDLEKKSYVNAKKQAIIDKAKSMGYSIQEHEENGVVKLKLIKRVY